MSNSQLEERQEHEAYERVAQYLALSVEELDQLEYDEGDEISRLWMIATPTARTFWKVRQKRSHSKSQKT